jgi:peptidoglycan/LPS O-acetylase OafA/YrhL
LNRIPSLDGFRAISILLVLFCHSRLSPGFPVSLADYARQGEVGVTIFFVISGFLITNLLLVDESNTGNINIRAFYTRRVFRIVPVYILYLLFILLWQNVENMGLTNGNLIHVLTFTVNFDPHRNWFLGHFWSLSVEEQFYLFWPAFLILFRKHLKIVLIMLVAYSCVVRVIAYKFPGYNLITLSPFFVYSDSIFIGAFGGILYFENPDFFKHKFFGSYVSQFAALSLFLAFLYFSEHGKLALLSLPFGNSIISASALFLICAYVQPTDNLIFKLLNNRFVIHMGILSYSIYIWQEFFFIGRLNGIWRMFPYNIGVIYLVALASYYLVEKPFLKLKKRLSTNKLEPVS